MTENNLYDYKYNALEAVRFFLVFSEEDIQKQNENCSFHPEMAHQVFGEGEIIFGYKNLFIDLYYLHNSSKCFMDIKYSDKVANFKVDSIADLLNSWLPSGYVSEIEDFRKCIQNEKHDKIFGSVIHQFERETKVIGVPNKMVTCKYKITQCDISDQLFQEYHQRFETLIIWFIDGANFIDLNDERWLIFYIYEEYQHPETNEIIVTPIGYTAIYQFFYYPNSKRARISQFFILPTHHRKGLGTELYKAVYNQIVHSMSDVVDITVEEPSESFQILRDICDSLHIYKNLKVNNDNIATKSPKILYKYMANHKICKKQAMRLSDILQYYNSVKSGNEEPELFKSDIKKRMKAQIEKEFGIDERVKARMPEESQESLILVEANLNTRYPKYLDGITPVVEKLKNILDK